MVERKHDHSPSARARASALGSLAMREHSVDELRTKLLNKKHDAELVERLLLDLQQENLLSNERYACSYWRVRSAKGYGPVRIRKELQLKGISESLIQVGLTETDVDFFQLVEQVYQKKYRDQPIEDFKDKQKRQAFLYRRGFDSELIRHVVND
ncbi:regulatory protein RecX [Marinicella sediminis]|uniref:Regulatory protein RecX n=1 Tax=Marinicella sediminis TaxID=1792834 RepID=A0ABV7JBT5_9GAMM|nr:regulatory protein RecX [Marinicella sediminis]